MMSETSPESVRFTGPEEEQLVRYRELNKMAVLALLFGLASTLTLVHPLLMLIPVAGVVCAVVALRAIRANPDVWTGAWLATAGLVLSIFFLGWGVGWSATRPGRLTTQAQRFADDWLRLVQQNELYAAHQLRQNPVARAPLTSRLDDYYRSQPPELLEGYQQFAKSPVVEALVKAGPDHPPEFHGVAGIDHSSTSDAVSFRYRLPPANGQPTWSLMIRVQLEADDRWQIIAVDGKQGEEWPELP